MDRLLPQGNVAYHARGAITGPLHIMSSYGANMVAPTKLQAAEVIEKLAVADWLKNYKRQPTKAEAEEKGAWTLALAAAFKDAKDYATRFLIWDPLAYYKACDENDMQDFLNSQGGPKDPWYAKGAFVVALAILGMLVLGFVFIGTKVMPYIQAAAAN